MSERCHISSLVVRVLPERLAAVISGLADMPGAEVHQSDAIGKVVVVLETENQGEIVDRLRAMESLPGVLNVSLIYHHVDDLPAHDHPERL